MYLAPFALRWQLPRRETRKGVFRYLHTSRETLLAEINTTSRQTPGKTPRVTRGQTRRNSSVELKKKNVYVYKVFPVANIVKDVVFFLHTASREGYFLSVLGSFGSERRTGTQTKQAHAVVNLHTIMYIIVGFTDIASACRQHPMTELFRIFWCSGVAC